MSPMKEAVARFSIGLPLFFLPFAALARNQPVVPAPIASPVSFGGMLQVLLGLGLVLAAVAARPGCCDVFRPDRSVRAEQSR